MTGKLNLDNWSRRHFAEDFGFSQKISERQFNQHSESKICSELLLTAATLLNCLQMSAQKCTLWLKLSAMNLSIELSLLSSIGRGFNNVSSITYFVRVFHNVSSITYIGRRFHNVAL